MRLLLRRAAAIIVALALAPAGWSVCAGWQTTPEARMECCPDSDVCAMHRSAESSAGPVSVLTQTQADRCCWASNDDDSAPSPGTFTLSPSTALVTDALDTIAPGAVRPASFDAWRTHVPRPAGVAKHLLLSVFLL